MKYRILFQAKKQKVHNVYHVENQRNKRKEKETESKRKTTTKR